MGGIIYTFKDGSTLEYAQGSFDAWCVYLTRPNIKRYPPKDFQYFTRLRQYAGVFGQETIYNDFKVVYEKTSEKLQIPMFSFIENLCKKYDLKALDVAIDFSIMYMGMVAEENKAYSKLGKRIKRLGVHQVLMENMSPSEAANFSRGKKWRELDALCNSKGF